MGPAPPSAVDARLFENPGDFAQSPTLLALFPNARNDRLLLGILYEKNWIDGIGLPTIRAAVRPCHSPSVRLMMSHGGGRALPNLIADQRIEGRQDGDKEFPDSPAGVHRFGKRSEIGPMLTQALHHVQTFPRVSREPVQLVDD